MAFTPDKLVESLSAFRKTSNNNELVILSTCNRTELYVNTSEMTQQEVIAWLADVHGINKDDIAAHIYQHDEIAAVEHLMRVAAGLDSLILGEPQILGQVKQSYTEAKRAGTINSHFEKLFQTTFAVAKQVRSQTDIGASAVSVAYAAVKLTKQIFSAIDKSHILLVGAGETIELVAKHLQDANAKSITVANRTLKNAQALAERFNGQSITISQIPAHLAHADVVISSTASALPLIGKGMVESALKARKHKPMLLLDLAVPRDIESEVSDLDDAYLYTVDDLQDIIDQNLANREQAAQQAAALIKHRVQDFDVWLQQSMHIDLIKTYREQAQQLRDTLTQKAMARIASGDDAQTVLQELSYKLSQQMMHGPTKALQSAIQEQDAPSLNLLADAFNLNAAPTTKQE
ncbi:glutamyl-tRNA reductase [Glaciecola siphonariae]|uniref:Glutamyl-tRNA reductase n=1 Tax=Glaciecola siphonariae TaxID=521012 RepID=A0ABV9LTS2_9ALTE